VAHADAVLDHQRREVAAIDQNDLLDLGGEVVSFLREGRRRDEHALVRPPAGQCAVEALDLRATHGILPALGLHVDLLEAQAVERDDAVDPAVAGAPYLHQRVSAGPVPHAVEQIENEVLEERRGRLSDQFEQITRQTLAKLRQRVLDALGRAERHRRCLCRRWERRAAVLQRLAVLVHVGEPDHLGLGQGLRVLLHERRTRARQLPEAEPWRGRKTGALEPIVRPPHSVLVDQLLAARQTLRPIIGAEPEQIGHGLVGLALADAVEMLGQVAEQRIDEAVVAGDAHGSALKSNRCDAPARSPGGCSARGRPRGCP
jgi:hypothetical protein